MKKEKRLSVLFAASEADPFVKVGGLADVAGSLPGAILALASNSPGQSLLDIRLVIPYHSVINIPEQNVKRITQYEITYRNEPFPVEVFETKIGNLPVYLLSSEWINSSERVYDLDIKLAARKYLFFSKAVAALPGALQWKVDILHANDWHTASAIPLSQQLAIEIPHSIITIHNLPFMGSEARGMLADFEIPLSTHPNLPDWARELPLPMACAAADRVVAVSPTYAKEIMSPEFGCDLDQFFLSIQKRVTGILNGLDLKVWNPATDLLLASNYDVNRIHLRSKNKQVLQEMFHLPVNSDVPLLVVISRIDRQKGIDLILESLSQLRDTSWQAILLGSGDITLESKMKALETEFPERVRSEINFNVNLSHQMYAGGDILLMPSRYEPCGLAQMIAMHYGCIPVARATGGLKDSIIAYEQNPDMATGFLFENVSSEALTTAIKQALDIYAQKAVWQRIQSNAMLYDFSWDKSAQQYINVYRDLENIK